MQKKFEFIISDDQKGQRTDQFLSARPEIEKNRSQTHKLILGGYVEINGVIPKASCKLKLNDRVVITVPPPQKTETKPEEIALDIVYEDKDLIVVNKARGMVVHPAAGNYSGTLVNALLYHCKDLSGIGGALRPGIVHRLDKDTSGLIVVAKNDFTHQGLAGQFKSKQVFKQYLALVHGEVKQAEGAIEAKIGRHPKHRKKMSVIRNIDKRTKGREAVTSYRVLERFKDYSLVELILKTGRTHQIRVHMHHIGHAIVGDPVYGHRKEEFKVSGHEPKRFMAGQLLHAARLSFIHPRTEKYMEFERAMPEDMQIVLKELRKKQRVQVGKVSQ